MKRTAKISGYSLKFHPTDPVAFALPNASEVVAVSTLDWKPVAKLAKVKYPRELSFADDLIVVSGIEGHIGVYERGTFACRNFFKVQHRNDNWGMFVDSNGQYVGLSAFDQGVLWVDCKSKETRYRFKPIDDSFFAPKTIYVQRGKTPEHLITLVSHTKVIADQLVQTMAAYEWDVSEDTPRVTMDLLSQPAQTACLVQCGLGLNDTLLITSHVSNHFSGWDLHTGKLVFDNAVHRDARLGRIAFAALPQRRLIAVASGGVIDFWNADMSILVHKFDTGHNAGGVGELDISPDERFIAFSDGKSNIYEIPDSLRAQ